MIPGRDSGGGGLVEDRVPPRWGDKWDRLTYLAAEYRMGVYLAALAVGALVVTGRWTVPELPPQLALGLQGFAIGIVPATVVGKVLIVDKFLSVERVRVAEVDPRDGARVDAHMVPPSLWEERERGEHPAMRLQGGEGADWAVTRLEYLEDVGELHVEGCNPELADPTSLISRDGKLEEIYSELLDTAHEHVRLKATLQSKAQQVEEAHANALVASYEYATAYSPGDTAQIVDEDAWSDAMPDADDRDPARSDDPMGRDSLTIDMAELVESGGSGNGANGQTEAPPEP